MLGIEDYGSDSDASVSPKGSSGTSNLSNSKRTRKKITISLPSLPVTGGSENLEDERPAKKPRTSAGTSSLLSMLPMPKQKSVTQSRVVIGECRPDHELSTQGQDALRVSERVSLPLKPSSLEKNKRNISVEEISINQATQSRRSSEATPGTNFFALGERLQLYMYETNINFYQATLKPQRTLMSQPRPPSLLLFLLQLLPYPRSSLLNLHQRISTQDITNYLQVFGLPTTLNIMPNL